MAQYWTPLLSDTATVAFSRSLAPLTLAPRNDNVRVGHALHNKGTRTTDYSPPIIDCLPPSECSRGANSNSMSQLVRRVLFAPPLALARSGAQAHSPAPERVGEGPTQDARELGDFVGHECWLLCCCLCWPKAAPPTTRGLLYFVPVPPWRFPPRQVRAPLSPETPTRGARTNCL